MKGDAIRREGRIAGVFIARGTCLKVLCLVAHSYRGSQFGLPA